MELYGYIIYTFTRTNNGYAPALLRQRIGYGPGCGYIQSAEKYLLLALDADAGCTAGTYIRPSPTLQTHGVIERAQFASLVLDFSL